LLDSTSGRPRATTADRRNYFSLEEKELYLSLFSDAKRQFNTYLDQGTILNSTCRHSLYAVCLVNPLPAKTTPAIQSKCYHILDRQCIKQYLNTAIEQTVCCQHVGLIRFNLHDLNFVAGSSCMLYFHSEYVVGTHRQRYVSPAHFPRRETFRRRHHLSTCPDAKHGE
jgi:hypothetical protein